MRIREALRALWMKIHLRGTLYGDKGERFDRLYVVEDPWHMGSDREQRRFQEVNRIIESEIGPVTTLLECGCGEGHQTEHLVKVCEELHGFDVSDTAVARAVKRCPQAHLVTADLASYEPPPGRPRFDLVVAAEILYYLGDVPAALRRMAELGRCCLVTYFESGPHVLDRYFSDIEDKTVHTIEVGDTRWKVVWWRPGHPH